jgi:hypothetical protein
MKIGDLVKIIKRDGHYFRLKEVGRIVKRLGVGGNAHLLVQSLDPSYGDGLWWTLQRHVKPAKFITKPSLLLGDIIKINDVRYVVAALQKSHYVLISLVTGLRYGATVTKTPLYLDDFIGGDYDIEGNNSYSVVNVYSKS